MVRSIWCGFRPEADRQRALRVEVDQQHLAAELGQRGTQVDGGRRLADAALLVAHRDDPGGAVGGHRARARAGRASAGRWGRATTSGPAARRRSAAAISAGRGCSTRGAATERLLGSRCRSGGGAGGRVSGGTSEAALPNGGPNPSAPLIVHLPRWCARSSRRGPSFVDLPPSRGRDSMHRRAASQPEGEPITTIIQIWGDDVGSASPWMHNFC